MHIVINKRKIKLKVVSRLDRDKGYTGSNTPNEDKQSKKINSTLPRRLTR